MTGADPAPGFLGTPRERHAWRVAVALGGLVPVAAGLGGVLRGPALIEGIAAGTSFDSHFRYLSAILLAIGLAFWSTIPATERCARRFRLLTLLVFVGGLGRLYAVSQNGLPSLSMMFSLGMELVVIPLLCLWQWRLLRQPTTVV